MVEAALGQIRPKADAKKISLCYEKPDGGKVLLCEEKPDDGKVSLCEEKPDDGKVLLCEEKSDAGKVLLCEEKPDAGKDLLCEEKPDAGMISLRGEKQACVAKYDPKWTQEAVFNLLDNAVKYSPEGSEITVSMQEYEMFSCISISDQGIGIPEEEQPLIFGRFYRGSEVREQSGVGIGLYLTRQIIEGQGGYVTVRSEMGRGTTFQVYLPR
ncbi:MAG: sensor histidine kinase [Acetatifactor sp.]|nr:sensor histidine kinase [Acetatifactor sp.]